MWCEWFHPIFDISADEHDGRSFYAENKVWNIGGILLSSVVASATVVRRGKLNLSRAPADHWVITYNRRGNTAIATDKGTLQALTGVPFIWSMGDRTSSQRSDVDRIQLLIPRDMFRNIAPLIDASRGGMLNAPLGRMLGDYMLFLESRLSSIAEDDLPRLANAVQSMIAACVAPSGERLEIAAGEIDSGRRERICRIIHSNLRSSALTPAMICKVAGVSRSQLYRIFENDGGVLRYIQRQRLLQCHAILSDPESRQSISSIAECFCFDDASGFSRAFRREFGHSPSEVKYAAEAGMPISAAAKSGDALEPKRFRDLLIGGPSISAGLKCADL